MKRTTFILLLIVLCTSVSAQLYDIGNLTNATDIYQQSVELNVITNGLVGVGFILTTFAITFVLTSINTGDGLSGIVAGSFIATVGSVILLPLELIGMSVFTMSLILFFASTAAKILIR